MTVTSAPSPKASTQVSATDPIWHALSPEEAAQNLSTRITSGLASSEVAERLATFGPNRIAPPKQAGPVTRFLRQFNNILIYVLMAAAGITALLQHWVDAGVILLVVLVNAIIGFLQEGKAERALAAIRDMLAPLASVVRDGHRMTVPGADLVPGDLVILEAGDRVPADIRLTEVHSLSVQEAILTGESAPVGKTTDTSAPSTPLGDRTGMAFSGTIVAAGHARGLVTTSGQNTELGRISNLIGEVSAPETPLVRQMAVFAKWLTAAVLLVSAVILAVGLSFGGYSFRELFMAVVGLSVAAIPEGLPAILTVTLAIGVQGMARRHAIVRRLPAIEALGSVSVICSDKTGTLTKNEMTVTKVVAGGTIFTVSGAGYAPKGGFLVEDADTDAETHPVLMELCRAALLCNTSELTAQNEEWHVTGDPMEGALVTLAMKAGLDPVFERETWPRSDAIPFDSRHRFMASLHHDHTGRAAVYLKGAPERIFSMCRHHVADHGTESPFDESQWSDQMHTMAAQGLRVLAIAKHTPVLGRRDLVFGDVEDGLTLLGLVGFIDPPRDEAIRAVADCHKAGIRVIMITGDHAGTALAVARTLGLRNTSEVVEGAELEHLDPADLQDRAARVDVFARTSPEHKLRLVEALQAQDAVVAMTGDGVNDAPALKRADIGIAMGIKGSEAAKEAAEIVLADDNFATIAAAVKAGRTVYDNLKKAIVFLLPVNGGESLSLVAAILFGLTLPITPVQILWVNMVSSVVLAMTLAFEPSEPGVMARPPRRANEPVLSALVLWRVVFVSSLFCLGIFGKFAWAQFHGGDLQEARTIAVNTLVVMEIFYLFSVRYLHGPSITLKGILGTRPVLIAVAIVTALQALFTYAPFMEAFFGTRPLSIAEVLQVVLVGVVLLAVLELEKRLRHTFVQRRRAEASAS